jgi:hypothetical protein
LFLALATKTWQLSGLGVFPLPTSIERRPISNQFLDINIKHYENATVLSVSQNYRDIVERTEISVRQREALWLR